MPYKKGLNLARMIKSANWIKQYEQSSNSQYFIIQCTRSHHPPVTFFLNITRQITSKIYRLRFRDSPLPHFLYFTGLTESKYCTLHNDTHMPRDLNYSFFLFHLTQATRRLFLTPFSLFQIPNSY